MMDNLDFSEEEIQGQLAALGYKNIPNHKLRKFKQDLDELVRREEWKSLTSSAQIHSSPPAYTKEKVSRCVLVGSEEGFFLHAGKVDQNRQVLSTCQNRDQGQQQGAFDSYAQHSVALNPRLPPGAPSRLQVEPDPDDSLHPPLSDSYASTPDSHRERFIKRKVLRKHKGQSLVCDESVYSEDSDAASSLEERLADLHLSSPAQRHFETENQDVSGQSDTQSSDTDGVSFSAFESYMRGMTQTERDGDLRPKPKSFIRPVMSRKANKTDPVAKYFQYKQFWGMFTLPGESDRRALRSEIKERLAYQPPPPKPRRVFVPNSYIVPTEKKRSALRWEIRNDLANGLLPYKYNYRF